MNPGVRFHEEILDRVVIGAGEWSGGSDYAMYRHADSRHAFTEAYGRPQGCFACWCDGPVWAVFPWKKERVSKDRRQRFLLKLVATWREWRKWAHPVTISLNGTPLHDEPLFLENISTGWPGIYFNLPEGAVRDGENTLEIVSQSGGENTLLLARAEIIRQPDIEDFSVHSVSDAVAVGEEFRVTLHLLSKHPAIRVAIPGGEAEMLSQDDSRFQFRALKEARGAEIVFSSGDKTIHALVGEIGPCRSADRLPVWIGLDGDDVRHDTTGEMDRILTHFIHSGLGNYIGYRAVPERNFYDTQRPTADCWRRWIRQCADHDVSMHYAGPPACLDGVDFAAEAGACFSGYQFHEPYLVFQPLVAETLMTDALKSARDFAERKEAYVDYLRARVTTERRPGSIVWSGEPALTCFYAAEAGVDGLLCEPVSNVSLLYGAARGSGKPFGAHIPGDWYFGYPHDVSALKRLRLALLTAYAAGARILYIESTVFKTNAHDRHDWESNFCRGVRQLLRDAYRFSRLDDRVGKPRVPLAFIYGHLESLFWMDDDRIPETFDMGNWDRLHWGLPGKTTHRRVWEASEAWLPRVPVDNFRNESLTRMFTGTPYGAVDVVQPTANLSSYRAVAFLGWNSMTEEIYENLLAYVHRGGALFLCGCHLDTRVSADTPPSLIRNGQVADLLGLDISGPGSEWLPGIRRCELTPRGARPMDEHFWRYDNGRGRVCFGDFYDYPTDPSLIQKIRTLLSSLGEEIRDSEPVPVRTSTPFVSYTLWEHQGQRKLYAIDTEWSRAEKAPPPTLTVHVGGQETMLRVPSDHLLVQKI